MPRPWPPRPAVWLAPLTLALTLSACSAPQPRATADAPTPTGQEQAASPWKPLDQRLSQYSYPHEVKVFSFQAQGQALEMAYMDVAPQGEPSGQTVLLLHGKNFSGAYWEDTIAALTQAGHRVVVPDQVGFGKSSKPTNIQYSFHALATWTRDLLAQLKIERVHVVGHSMGGMVAARFALMFPQQTLRLVLVNPIGLEDWKRKVPYQTVDQWTTSVQASTPEKIQAYMQKNYFDGQWKQEWDELVALQAGWAIGPDSQQMARVSALTYDMIFTQPVVYEFPDIKAPTLLLIGTRDRTALGKPLVSPELRQTMGLYQELGKATAAAIPGATLVEFEDVGHLPQVEAFEAYRAALLDFLKP